MGRGEEGLALLMQGTNVLRAAGSNMPLLMMAPWVGEVYDQEGRAEEGLLMLDELISQSIGAGFLQMMPQNQQCRGELLHKPGKPDEAEVAFETAVEVARRQQAKGPELRAMLSLARFWASQGRSELADRRLREVYNWFTEGFDTPDLVEAKAFLG